MLALPVRFGGIGVQNPVKTADYEYETSIKITEDLKRIICNNIATHRNEKNNRIRQILGGCARLCSTEKAWEPKDSTLKVNVIHKCKNTN